GARRVPSSDRERGGCGPLGGRDEGSALMSRPSLLRPGPSSWSSGPARSAILEAMTRVRFAPSPTGSLHLGNELSALANRHFGDWLLLRIDDTDAVRNLPGGEEAILRELEWLGIAWDDGPVRQSDRQDLYRSAAERLGGDRFGRVTLLREDGSATYHLAS